MLSNTWLVNDLYLCVWIFNNNYLIFFICHCLTRIQHRRGDPWCSADRMRVVCQVLVQYRILLLLLRTEKLARSANSSSTLSVLLAYQRSHYVVSGTSSANKLHVRNRAASSLVCRPIEDCFMLRLWKIISPFHPKKHLTGTVKTTHCVNAAGRRTATTPNNLVKPIQSHTMRTIPSHKFPSSTSCYSITNQGHQ